MAGVQTLSDRFSVITPVAYHAIRTMARTPSFALQNWNRINECQRRLRIVTIGPGELDGQRYTTSIVDKR
jgi:hypothetical protein